MKTYMIRLLSLCFCCCLLTAQMFAQDQVPTFIPGEIYFKVVDDYAIALDPTTDAVNVEEQIPFFESYMQTFGVVSIRRSYYFAGTEQLTRVFRVKIKDPSLAEELLASLSNTPEVEYAEAIPLAIADYTPNDLGANTTSGQYGLYITNAQAAWDIATGNGRTIAIVDNAFFLNHPDLVGKFVAGFDAADNDNDPSAPNTSFAHGTHVAGIAGAETDNSIGVASMGYNAALMPIKATENTVSANWITHGYEGIVAAADMGANIINCSWGGGGTSNTQLNAINYAVGLGTIIVAAAGNSGSIATYYPAAYSGVVSVASTDINDQRSGFSTYGSSISVCAPGSSIYSSLPGGYGIYSGTSMASPMVAGLSALVWSVDPGKTNQQVIDCILNTADNIDAQNPSYVGLLGAGRINAEAAVACTVCPPMITLVSPTDDIFTTSPSDFEADMSIEASNVIGPNTSVDYDAGEYVLLTDGFFAQETTTFHAFIDGCGGAFLATTDEPNFIPQALLTPSDESHTEAINNMQLSASPNPFTSQTNVRYVLSEKAIVQIGLFNSMGQQIKNLTNERLQEPGSYSITIQDEQLPSGLYYCRIIVDQQVHQLSLVKE